MRRILTLLLLALSAVAFVVAFVNTDDAQRARMQAAASSVGQPFTVPGDPRLADPERTYSALLEAARRTHVNVLRTSAGFTQDDRPQITQYVLLTGPTGFYGSFGLDRGRWLSADDTRSPGPFLSTVAGPDRAQVGVLHDFGGDDLVTVRGLQAAFDSLPTAGQYQVEARDPASYDRFLTLVAQMVDDRGAPGAEPLSAASFKASATAAGTARTGHAGLLTAVEYLIVFLVAVLLVYRLLYETKRAGVMKLGGFSTLRVWYETSGRLVLAVMLASAVLSALAAALVPDVTAAFVATLFASLLRTAVVMLAASLLTCLYISRIRVGEAIKNRKDTRSIFAVNTAIKAVCALLLVTVGAGLWGQYANVAAQKAKLGNWDATRAYGVFYPTGVGNDLLEMQAGQAGPTTAEAHDLYPVLDKAGSLYVDANAYQTEALRQPLPPGSFRSLQVNTNYLRAFPIRDASGRPVVVPEATTDWVVLAPVKDKPRESELLSYFQSARTGSPGQPGGAYRAQKAVFGTDAPPAFAQQKVKIVWTADDQRVFSFNPAVAPTTGNVLVDPVVQVMTPANSLDVDRANAMTGDADSALKVRLTGGSTAATRQELAPTLRSLHLDDNLKHVVTMNEYVFEQLQSLQRGVRDVAIAATVLAVGMLVLVLQSLTIVFERYSRKVVVRRLFGLRFTATYREFILLFCAVWALQLLGALAANRAGVSLFSTATSSGAVSDGTVLAVASVVVAAELLFSVAVLTRIERRNLPRVLKGEF